MAASPTLTRPNSDAEIKNGKSEHNAGGSSMDRGTRGRVGVGSGRASLSPGLVGRWAACHEGKGHPRAPGEGWSGDDHLWRTTAEVSADGPRKRRAPASHC